VTRYPSPYSSSTSSSPLPEIQFLEQLFSLCDQRIRVRELATVYHKHDPFPIYSIHMGNPDPKTPKIAFIGGVHGLERIGSQIVIAYLETLINRLEWDALLHHELENLELILLPVINPVGMYHGWRANGNGVDLMRNAPVDAEGKVSFMVGGHRLGPWLPWYRGRKNEDMQQETQILVDTITEYLLPSPFSMVLDCHSGFGMEDRIWFPYAGTSRPPENLAEIYALKQMFAASYPNQNYIIEPQTHHYTTHGDIWDYLYKNAQRSGNTFLPFTLELGSWRWVRKNPWQIKSLVGLFNPVMPHRLQRALRRHNVLLEFLLRATMSFDNWLPRGKQRLQFHHAGLDCWYDR
jgi:hypothetical protein